MHARFAPFAMPLLVFAATLLAYVWTMPRLITLEDAGLFQMVCHLGGISHPPGYPVFTQLCQQLVRLPLGLSPVVQGNLISALFAAAAVAVFYQVALLLLGDRRTALVAALGYGFSATFWSQAIIIEVYSLAALLFMLAWWLALRFQQQPGSGRWALLCLVVGLGLANHWPLMVLSSLAIVATLLARLDYLLLAMRKPTFWLLSVGCVFAGLLPYLSLVLDPEPTIALYGGIHSLADFGRYVARSAYNDNHAVATVIDKMHYARWLGIESCRQLGLLALPAIVIGLLVSWRQLSRFNAIALLLVYLGTTFLLLGLLNFEFSPTYKAVFKPYPLIAYSALALWFAMGLQIVIDRVHQHILPAAKWVPRLVCVFAVVSVLLTNFGSQDRRQEHLSDAYGRTVLGLLPADAVLFVGGDNELGPIGYLHLVEGVRPDIELRAGNDLLFANRLASPYAGSIVHDRLLLNFLTESKRPIYSTTEMFAPATDYGLMDRLNRGGLGNTEFTPEADAFLDYLLVLYAGDLIRGDHEQQFLLTLLNRYGGQYASAFNAYLNREGQVGSWPGPPITQAQWSRYQRLQSTYPALLATLLQLLDSPVEENTRRQALAVAARAQALLPAYVDPEDRAILLTLTGRAFLLDPADHEAGERLLQRSLDLWPDQQSTSICSLAASYGDSGRRELAAKLHVRFPQAECP
jgi:4-amino-4-deoxy-L-arabinose transferase-like glycosyltransferase